MLKLKKIIFAFYYRRRGGYIFVSVCLLVCWFASRTDQKLRVNFRTVWQE